jgi:hypothetical protein
MFLTLIGINLMHKQILKKNRNLNLQITKIFQVKKMDNILN